MAKTNFDAKDLSELLQATSEIAKQAGEAILQYYRSEYEVFRKEDKSLVTSADLAANQIIQQGLNKLSPKLPILSEESELYDFAERKQWGPFWLVDPLDGTREFINDRPDFTVNIALIEQQKPILGVIYLPADKVLYAAASGLGASKQIGQEASQAIHVATQAQQPMRTCGGRSAQGEKLIRFMQRLVGQEMIRRGSSLKSCLVAEGSIDLYPRFGPTWEWDTAAAQSIVEEAGGFLTNLQLEPLQYNKESLLNPGFLVFADNSIDWRKLLEQ